MMRCIDDHSSFAIRGRFGRWSLIVAVAIGLGGCGAKSDEASDDTNRSEVPRNVRVVQVERSDLNEYLTISGPAAPLRGTDLNAEETGQVRKIPNDKGSIVRAGDPLVVLDRRLLEAEMRSAKANRELSAYNEERTRKLFEANAVSEIEMLEAETRLEQVSAVADMAAIRYERAATSAPYAGIVADRFVELGQFVGPGTPIARIVDPYVLKLEGAVTEREIRFIDEGMSAEVLFDGVEEPAQGYVHWVGFEADRKTGKFGVEIRIDNHDMRLRPGVIARAQVLKAVHGEILAVPRDAIIERNGGPTAFVVEDNVAVQRQLILGPDQGLMVVVTDGLAPGDRLIVRGHRQIHDGSVVVVQEEATSPDGSIAADPSEPAAIGAGADVGDAELPSAGEDR
jgi:RND family efflux transporter MFP subunit